MVVANSDEFRSVLQQVATWPPEVRLTLARRLLEITEPVERADGRRGYSAAEVAALINSRQPAPDDATTNRWIDEMRIQKYGP